MSSPCLLARSACWWPCPRSLAPALAPAQPGGRGAARPGARAGGAGTPLASPGPAQRPTAPPRPVRSRLGRRRLRPGPPARADGGRRPARIAVHTSQPGLDRCAALARVAWPGQVLLSQASAGLVADSLPAGADLADLGWHRLADLGPAEHVWQLRHPDLPAAFPPLRSLDAYRHNLPVELTSFVPRDAELAELAALTDGARLVTLTGSGGCGKTRLALHAAAGRVGAHADGVWLAELAALRDPAQVAAAIADVLQVRQRGPDRGPAELAAAIGTRSCCWSWTTASTSSAPAPRWPMACCGPARGCASSPPAASRWACRARSPGGCPRCRSRPTRRWCRPTTWAGSRPSGCSPNAPAWPAPGSR